MLTNNSTSPLSICTSIKGIFHRGDDEYQSQETSCGYSPKNNVTKKPWIMNCPKPTRQDIGEQHIVITQKLRREFNDRNATIKLSFYIKKVK